MVSNNNNLHSNKVLSTGITGLDAILGSGLTRDCLYLI